MHYKSERTLLLLALTLPALLLVTALCSGCRTQSPHAPAPPAIQSVKAESDEYAGNRACEPCHLDEFTLHAKSRHAATLHIANSAELGALAPPVGKIANTPFSLSKESDGSLTLARNDEAKAKATLQYALGSGKTVMTYLGEMKKDKLTELRASYQPPLKKWCITPGQEQVPDAKIGVVNELGTAKRCVLCHAVKLKANSSEPAPGFLGVGCESCHGPGKAHIEAVKIPNATDIKMASLKNAGGKRINELCGKCHRTLDSLTLGALETNSTARFQPYGLAISPCFQKSNDKLTCITCHNPHTDASVERKGYEKTCLSCHSAPVSAAPKTQKVCPVNPKEGCIGCHMPPSPIFIFAKIQVSMADHFIWAYRPHGAGSKGREAPQNPKPK